MHGKLQMCCGAASCQCIFVVQDSDIFLILQLCLAVRTCVFLIIVVSSHYKLCKCKDEQASNKERGVCDKQQ